MKPLALLLLLVTAGTSTRAGDHDRIPPTAPLDDCWLCDEDCGDGSHMDQLPGLDEGRWRGGTFVNMCRIAYSECFDYHDPCPPTDDEDNLTFSLVRLQELEESIRSGDTRSIGRLLDRYAGFAAVASSRNAVEVKGCDGRTFALLPFDSNIARAIYGVQPRSGDPPLH